MNSGAKTMKGRGWFALLAAGILALLAAACADHGPTNIYAPVLFGQKQSGPNLQFSDQEFTLSATAGTANGIGPDQYVIYMKDTGPGGLIGPVTAVVTKQATCATIETNGGAPMTSQTVIFGNAGQTIYPGDVLVGNASNMSGHYQYSVQVGWTLLSCSNTAETFTLTATDASGGSWNSTFSGTDQ